MNIRHSFLILAVSLSSIHMHAQTTKEEVLSDLNKAGGIYYAYPDKSYNVTPAPKVYKPFYISHYGRHGSRYLISDNDYSGPINILHKAFDEDALTPLGINLMHRLDSIYIETADRAGDLSPLGVKQHRGIAERMVFNYPEVFKNETTISARSTTVIRCVLSMDAFCERLKELNPKLDITRESSQKYMSYLNYHSPESNEWYDKEFKMEEQNFEKEKTNPDRLITSLFSDPGFVRKNVDKHQLMWALYYLAVGMQNIETDITLMDIFTEDELFDLWQVFNFRFYGGSANYAGNRGLEIDNAKYLLQNIIDSAEEALIMDTPSVTLRFGHDGNVIPLAGILEFPAASGKTENAENAFSYFADFKVAPMAGNVQMIFFKNPKDSKAPILVKFLLNEEEQRIPLETDMWPFYKWDDVKTFYQPKLPQ